MPPFEAIENREGAGSHLPENDPPTEETLRFMDIELHWRAHRVRRGVRLIHLSTLEMQLLRFLMLSPNRVFTRDEILRGVWPHGIFVTERTVDVHIAGLRRALHDPNGPNPLRTVRGRGYSLDNSVWPSADP